MITTSRESEAGTALLLAAAPAGKGRLIDAASALPGLAAVDPGVLTGTRTGTVVELADPLDPQTVLTRLRAVAAGPGPLSLYLAGQLHLDGRQQLPHLALARTTASTVRYTGLPWHWLAGELAARRPGTTTVIVDLVAEAAAWQHLAGHGPGLPHGVRVFGRIAPPPPRRQVAEPSYLKACAAVWRTGARPALTRLHELAAARAGTGGAMLLCAETATVTAARAGDSLRPEPASASGHAPPSAPVPAPVPRQQGRPHVTAHDPAPDASDPHPAILAAARAGRHREAAAAAAAWEQEVWRTHGPGSGQALHWLEVRADLARLAGDPGRSCELWMAAAGTRLRRQQAPDHPDVEAAVDRAHHQWEQLRDTERARTLAPDLVTLRRRVPGRQRGALLLLQRRLEQLHAEAGRR
ncbi:hypothetical protein [Streptomyces sp. GC420]|uniref:hypothetical protein n=1 Tax=Streptomyces sp. GC420 TaxID=2697568 RepID=UPI001414FE4B|nr:hypothetical protein [Streptomyces sp. GC420]NBM15161.1 hypothetical protein [Streptomyces sp. GC420]